MGLEGSGSTSGSLEEEEPVLLEYMESSLNALVQLLFVALAGTFLARLGFLKNEDSKKSISNMIFYVFMPCLLFANIGSSLNSSMLLGCLSIVLFAFIHTAIGLLMGLVIDSLFNRDTSVTNFILVANSFGNYGNLPVAILSSICAQPPFTPSIASKALTYVSVYYCVMSFLFSVLALPAIVPGDSPDAHNNTSNNKPPSPSLFASDRNGNDHDNNDIEILEVPVKPSPLHRTVAFLQKCYKKFLTPPTMSTLLALVISLVGPLQKLIFGGDVPLEPLRNSAVMLGACTTPLTILLLGANLAWGPKPTSAFSKTCIGAICLSRLVVLPIISTGLVVVTRYLLPSLIPPEDNTLQLVILLEGAMPSALNLLMGAQMVSEEVADSVSTLLFWQYIAGAFTLLGWISAYMRKRKPATGSVTPKVLFSRRMTTKSYGAVVSRAVPEAR